MKTLQAPLYQTPAERVIDVLKRHPKIVIGWFVVMSVLISVVLASPLATATISARVWM